MLPHSTRFNSPRRLLDLEDAVVMLFRNYVNYQSPRRNIAEDLDLREGFRVTAIP